MLSGSTFAHFRTCECKVLHNDVRAFFICLINNRDRGGGGAGRAAAPPLFCAPAPTFCAKGKIIKLKKKDLKQGFFPSIFRYILCIFFNFKRQAFCGAPVLFAVIVPCHALATPSLRSAACFVLPAPAEFFISFIRRNEENY